MAKHPLQQLLEEIGGGTRSYSGRGMHGKKCLGVELDNSLGDFIADVIDALQGNDDTADVAEAFRSMSQDSMGRGTIVYFPNVPYENDGSDDDETDATK